MITYDEIGRRIRDARQELGLMQADLGQRLSRPRSHAAISDIERGRTKLNVEELAELALVLQKPLSYFTEPTQPRSIVYRRSEIEQSEAHVRENDRAIEAFKNLARIKAREQRPKGPA